MRKTLKKFAATLAACTMAFALAASVVPNTAEAGVDCSKAGKKAGKADIDLDGTYHAYFNFQQKDTWIFRDTWFNPATGKGGKDLTDDLPFEGMLQSKDGTIVSPGTVTDVEIKGNGTYKVGVTGLDGSIGTAEEITMIGINTDIPIKAVDDGTITISDMKLLVDGSSKWEDTPYTNLDAKEWGLTEMDIVNTYQNAGYNSPTIMAPNDSVEIVFTVSGFNSDNPDAVAESGDDAAGDDAAAGNDAAATGNEATASSGGNTTAIVVVVIIVVIIAAIVAVVVVKKKKN